MRPIQVSCLGSGSALSRSRIWSSLLINESILLGLPPTAVTQMNVLGKDVQAVQHVFVSHLHADHHFGLPFLLLTYCYLYERDDPVYIIGPTGIEEAASELFDLAWPDLRGQGVVPRVPLVYIEVDGDGSTQAGGLAFDAIRMRHFGMDAYGYRFSCNGRQVAFTGDTGDCPQLTRLIEGVDLLITEFTHAFHSEDPGHMNADAVQRLAARVTSSGGKVLATHLGGNPEPIQGVKVCQDGESYVV